MNPNTSRLIKATSTILITAALGLEIWNIYLFLNNTVLPDWLEPFFWIGNVALVAHGIEGIIAGFKVRDRNSITYGIYTFFVGFIGLKELSQ